MAVAGSLTYDTKLDTKGFQEGLSKVGSATKTAFKGVGVAIGAVATAITGVTVASTKAYADYEQLVGGVETLFGAGGKSLEEYAESVGKTVDNVKEEYDELIRSQETVVGNAANAYKTAGISANKYMETVTSFSASLLQSLEGDTEKAAEYADRAIIDMSDNANKMGTSMEMIQNAYQGFAKQNYTMLDNLKLGYGGTKTEMERLIEDASKMKDVQKELGITVDANSMSFGNIVNAISVMQESMGIAGTTAKEANTTISGSINSMKAAWEDLLVAFANKDLDLGIYIETLFDTISTVATNIMPVVTTVLQQVPTFIEQLITVAVQQIPTVVEKLIPTVLNSAVTILNTLIQGIQDNLDKIIKGAMTIVMTLINGILPMLPQILEMGITILVKLLEGIAEALPDIIPTIVQVILKMVDTILDNLDEILEAGIEVLLALALGLIEAIPDLLEKVPEIITKLVEALLKPEMLSKLISAALQLILALAGGLIQAIPQLLMMVPTIISSLTTSLKEVIKTTDWKQLGKNILDGILDGLTKFGNSVKNAAKKLFNSIKDNIKSFFGIHSPSRVMRDEIGKFIPQGIAVGIEADTDSALNSIDKMNDEIMNKMNQAVNMETAKASFSGTSGSVSQILSANSVIQVQNYNTLELDGEVVYENQQQVQQRKDLQYSFGGGTSK